MITLNEWAAKLGDEATDQKSDGPHYGPDPREEFIEKLMCGLKPDLADLDIMSNVGRSCAAVVTQYTALARFVDSHPHVIDPLVKSCIATMEIWLFG